MSPPFYPLRLWQNRRAAVHEAGHAATGLAILGTGHIEFVELERICHKLWRAAQPDQLTILAGGLRAAQLFGHDQHGGGKDIEEAAEIWRRMPRGALEWKDALARADQIVYERRDFIEELGSRLEREFERGISGADVDKLWLEFYPPAATTASYQRNVVRPLVSREDDDDIQTKVYDPGGSLIGFAKRLDNGNYLAVSCATRACRVIGPSRRAAELGLTKAVAEQRLRWRTDGVMQA